MLAQRGEGYGLCMYLYTGAYYFYLNSITYTVQSSLFMVLFITGLGMILYWNGEIIRQPDTALPASFKLEFSGAIIATVFSVGNFFVVF